MSPDLSRHYEICRRDDLPVIGPVYRPFRRRRQRKQLPFYRELINFVNLHEQVSDRQFYYHLVEQPVNSPLRLDVSTKKKADAAYSKVIGLTVTCRLAGLIPLDSIVDDTDLLGTPQYDCPIEEYLSNQVYRYRSNWFENQDSYVEVWLEKRALSRIFYDVTNRYGVSLSVSGKYPSWAQINSGIDRLESNGKEDNIILYFGDLDCTGKDMPRFLREAFPTLGFNNVSIEEIAVNVADVEEYSLPTIPLKRKDKRFPWFTETFNIDYGVEIDALPPDILRQKIGGSILAYLNVDEINRKKEEDRQAKQNLSDFLQDLRLR